MGMSCKYVFKNVHRNHIHTNVQANVRIMYLCMYISHGESDEVRSCIGVHQQQQQLCFCFVFVLNAILPFLTHLVPFSYLARLAYVLKPESVRLWVAEPLCYTKWQMHFVHTHALICRVFKCICVYTNVCVWQCLHCNFFTL